MQEDRKLSEEEIEEISKKVVAEMEHRLYLNVGTGIIALAWKGIILIIIALAAYGMGHGMFK